MLTSQLAQTLTNAHINLNALATGQRATAVARATMTARIRRALSIRISFTARIAFNNSLHSFIARLVSLLITRILSLNDQICTNNYTSTLDDDTAGAVSMNRQSGDILIVQGISTYGANRSRGLRLATALHPKDRRETQVLTLW